METVTVSIVILSCDPLVWRMNQQLYQCTKRTNLISHLTERQLTSRLRKRSVVLNIQLDGVAYKQSAGHKPLLFDLCCRFLKTQKEQEEALKLMMVGDGGWMARGDEDALGGKFTAHTLGHE